MTTCGSTETLSGEPCGQKVKEGRCRFHSEDARLHEAKKVVLREYRQGKTFTEAAAAAGYSDPTCVWRWRQIDPEFDAQVSRIQEHVDQTRVARVEESLFTRIVQGNATAAETIFWLVNRSRGRWRHVQRVEVSGPEGGPIRYEVEEVRAKLETELERIMARRGAASASRN